MVPVGNSGLKEQRLGGTADSANVISFHPNAYFPFLKKNQCSPRHLITFVYFQKVLNPKAVSGAL